MNYTNMLLNPVSPQHGVEMFKIVGGLSDSRRMVSVPKLWDWNQGFTTELRVNAKMFGVHLIPGCIIKTVGGIKLLILHPKESCRLFCNYICDKLRVYVIEVGAFIKKRWGHCNLDMIKYVSGIHNTYALENEHFAIYLHKMKVARTAHQLLPILNSIAVPYKPSLAES